MASLTGPLPTTPGDTARLYHRLSSYAYIPGELEATPADHPMIRQDFVRNHLPTFPAPFKAYPPGLPRLALPRTWPSPRAAATSVLAGQLGPSADRLDLAQIARLLYLSAAVVRFVERGDGRRFFFRTSRSAGGLFPLELYVAANGVSGLTDGVHWYDPLRHSLVQIGPPPHGDASAIIVTGIPWRTGWRYAERGFRHLYWDAGTTLAHTLALADAVGLGARLWTRFPDEQVARLVGADGVQEFPLAVVTLGDGQPTLRPGGDATRGSVAESPVEFPLVTLAQRAGDADAFRQPWPPAPPWPGEPPWSADLDTVIVRHRSTRVMDPAAVLARETFERCVALGARGTPLPTFVAVHAIEGVEPGLYRWPDLDRPIRAGILRDELFRVCWDQELGRDAAFVVTSAVDLDALDDGGYRDAQIQAGLVDGRLHLAAYALGIGASGMTFLDSEIEGLLGEPLAGLLLTCVGEGQRVRG
ncbi:MAG: hypothetical protein ABIQ58_05675 [Candidatus Limnocylindrales bacterium]